jgi:hypothetical protein
MVVISPFSLANVLSNICPIEILCFLMQSYSVMYLRSEMFLIKRAHTSVRRFHLKTTSVCKPVSAINTLDKEHIFILLRYQL